MVLLVQVGLDIPLYKLGRTALHWTAYSGHTDTLKLLISYGANINDQDNEGNTPLHLVSKLQIFFLHNLHSEQKSRSNILSKT
jgi:ankyrin repeat protein